MRRGGLVERSIYRRLKLHRAIFSAYRRTDNKAEAGSIGRCSPAKYSVYLWTRSENRGVILPRYVGDIAAQTHAYVHTRALRSRSPIRDSYMCALRRIRRKGSFLGSWILCHSLRWPYITAPLSQRARCLILGRELVHSARQINERYFWRSLAAVRARTTAYAQISRTHLVQFTSAFRLTCKLFEARWN